MISTSQGYPEVRQSAPYGERHTARLAVGGQAAPAGCTAERAVTVGVGRIVPDWVEQCRLAHNPEVAGSNPAPATRKQQVKGLIAGDGGRALIFVAARRQQDLAALAGQERKELAENGSEGVADRHADRV
jgi:hypothetical protein